MKWVNRGDHTPHFTTSLVGGITEEEYMEVIYVPRRLIEKARELGIDINDVVLRALANTLNLDVHELTNARLEIAEKFLEEAKEYIRKRDPVQAFERLYRAVEECIKVLAEVLKAP